MVVRSRKPCLAGIEKLQGSLPTDKSQAHAHGLSWLPHGQPGFDIEVAIFGPAACEPPAAATASVAAGAVSADGVTSPACRFFYTILLLQGENFHEASIRLVWVYPSVAAGGGEPSPGPVPNVENAALQKNQQMPPAGQTLHETRNLMYDQGCECHRVGIGVRVWGDICHKTLVPIEVVPGRRHLAAFQ